MSDILYQRRNHGTSDSRLLDPIIHEIRRNISDPVVFDRKIREFISQTDLLPIPEKIGEIDRVVESVRETAEAWDLIVTVALHQHCILIKVELDESRDLTFLCEWMEFADHITLSEDPIPVVYIRYYTHGFCWNGKFL